jgi:hypothetical protein
LKAQNEIKKYIKLRSATQQPTNQQSIISGFEQ